MSLRKILVAVVALIVSALLVYQIPAVNRRLGWRVVVAEAYIRGVVNPAGELPTPAVVITRMEEPTSLPTIIPTEITADPTATALPSPTPVPASVHLASPEYEGQDWNNCGPAALSMYLKYKKSYMALRVYSINKIMFPEDIALHMCLRRNVDNK